MSEDSRSCPSCGAHVSPDASVCDLCGTPIEEADAPDPPATDTEKEATDGSEEDASNERSPSPNAGAEEAPVEQVYCHDCGWENPPGANYCSRCGTELQDVSDDAPPAGARPVEADLPTGSKVSAEDTAAEEEIGHEQAEMGRQILLVVGTAVVLVLGLFFVTQWSQQYEWGGSDESTPPAAAERQSGESSPNASPPSGGGATGPSGPSSTSGTAASPSNTKDLQTLVDQFGGSVEGAMASQVDSLQALIDGATGEEQRQLRSKLAQLYVGAGVPGRAALVQSKVAEQTDRVEDRRRVANLLYKWMRTVEQEQGRAEVAEVARHVAEAFAAVAEQRPEDLDARTRMGEAYLLTNNPMKGIQAINQVLEDDSTFVPARFQKGLALLQINRLDEAVKQFEQVIRHASQDDPFYQQAKKAIEVIRKQAESSESGQSDGSRSSLDS